MHYSPNSPGVATQETSASTDPVRVEKRGRFFQKNKVLTGFYLFVAFLLGVVFYFVLNGRGNNKELYRWNINKGRDSEPLNSDFIINSLLNSKRGKKFILSKLEELIVSYEKDFNTTDEKKGKRDYENEVIRGKHIRSGNQNDGLNKSTIETAVQIVKHDNNNDTYNNNNHNNGDMIFPIYEKGKIWNVSFVLDNLDGVVAFDNFMKTFQKEYETLDEKHKRFTNFMYNYLKIKEHNNTKDVYYKTGINNFSDMSYIEFRSKYLTLKSVQSTYTGNLNRFYTENVTDSLIETYKNKRLQQMSISGHKDDVGSDSNVYDDDDDLMLNYDWRYYDVAKNVKNQGACGSCWAFSAVASIEAQYKILKHVNVELSEQQLLDCSQENHGCDGGFLDAAFNYVLSSEGLCTEKDYPYLQVAKQSCFTKTCKKRYPIAKIYHVSIDQLKKAIRYIGPVSVDIYADDSFVFYSEGIFNGDCSEEEEPNHAVLAIGYGTTSISLKNGKVKDIYYYIVKNSWGTHWGENGYMRIKTNPNGTEQQCKFATDGYVATVMHES